MDTPYLFSKMDNIKWPLKLTKSQRAYILFYNKSKLSDDSIILSGKSSYSKEWSGFGGGRRDFEKDPRDTAIREIGEELFGWVYNHRHKRFSFNHKYIDYSVFYAHVMTCFRGLKNFFYSPPNIKHDLYVIYLVSFNQLEHLIQSLYQHYRHVIQSPFYFISGSYTLPSSIMNLIQTRKVSQQTKDNFRGEVDTIQIFKIQDILSNQHSVDSFFKRDVIFFKNVLNNTYT